MFYFSDLGQGLMLLDIGFLLLWEESSLNLVLEYRRVALLEMIARLPLAHRLQYCH
jgi:hypothetical protein